MCGIVGILGNHEVAPIILDALKRLEYRGYDSAGIATVNDGKLARRRALGKLVNLSDELVHNPLLGKAGIGHTRWATHGAPTIANAHPHRAGPVAVVHNGIIENFKELREELVAKGCTLNTETDTETVAMVFQCLMNDGKSIREAAAATIARLKGAFALCFLFEGEEDLLIAARKGSPLAIGHGDGEMFVGSDAMALSSMTDRLTYLEEGDWAIITRDGAEILDENGKLANRDVVQIKGDMGAVDKSGYKHFMAKEIAEQPTVLGNAISHYLNAERSAIELPDAQIDFTKIDRLSMVACGTAYLACSVAKYWFEQVAGIPVDVDIASEFRYRKPPLSPNSAAVFVSQSGETADTLAALRHAKEQVSSIISIVNVTESSIARDSDVVLPIIAGREIGVASTKAFTCQLSVLASLVLLAAHQKGKITADEEAAMVADLSHLPALLNAAMGLEGQIRYVAKQLANAQDIIFLGRGVMYPLALEGALKLKEISYIHAEGFASGELKHGPIALIDKNVPVVVFAPKDALFEKTVSNMQEVMARDGKVVLITDEAGAAEAAEGTWHTIVMPNVSDFLSPILYAVPAQLLAYHTAVAMGTDVDQPRNLAKSVTVE